MNKITTKFRTLGRLLGWVSISFGIAIAMSQMANAWIVENNNPAQSQVWRERGEVSMDWDYYDGKQEFGHRLYCGGNEEICGLGKGIDATIAIYPGPDTTKRYRLVYPPVHVPPYGILIFFPGHYSVSDNEALPNTNTFIPFGTPQCQHLEVMSGFAIGWVIEEMAQCDALPFPARI